MFGVSTNNLRRNFRWARKGIFSFSHAPLEFLFLGGIGLMAIAVLAVVFTISVWLLDTSIPRGLTTVVCLLFGFGGLQLLASAIVGEYVGKIIDETKKRPKYIVRTISNGSQLLRSSAAVQAFVSERESFRRGG